MNQRPDTIYKISPLSTQCSPSPGLPPPISDHPLSFPIPLSDQASQGPGQQLQEEGRGLTDQVSSPPELTRQ